MPDTMTTKDAPEALTQEYDRPKPKRPEPKKKAQAQAFQAMERA